MVRERLSGVEWSEEGNWKMLTLLEGFVNKEVSSLASKSTRRFLVGL